MLHDTKKKVFLWKFSFEGNVVISSNVMRSWLCRRLFVIVNRNPVAASKNNVRAKNASSNSKTFSVLIRINNNFQDIQSLIYNINKKEKMSYQDMLNIKIIYQVWTFLKIINKEIHKELIKYKISNLGLVRWQHIRSKYTFVATNPQFITFFLNHRDSAHYLLLKNENRARADRLSHITHGHETQPG